MSNSHECSACGGTGEPVCSWCSEGAHYATNYGCTDAAHWPDTCCIVCLGSGRISDVRTAADAMADAETLRIFARWYDVRRFSRYDGSLSFDTDWPLPTCHCAGCLPNAAQAAAHAAFRAVPALRGEA